MHFGFISQIEDDELGRRAPTFIKDEVVSSCMNCKANFGILRKRKHCKACGAVSIIYNNQLSELSAFF